MFELSVPLVERRHVSRDMWVLGFEAPDVAGSVRAGQFVNVLLRPGPLLRRPFSVHRVQAGTVEILLEPVGEGTRLLCDLRAGDHVSLLGPLGQGYAFDPSWGSIALVSGGLGVAPMPLAARDAHAAGLTVHWVHGARTQDELCREWYGDE
ncbi:MAG: dihydroorotate dehydrogenase electron transfer subunit, partial [Candidatus Dormibacteraeota bacterium]|nr:dihydroorotate dehydrogenase electron transfer subunit [Candidatus Dormibacteraeota bacterium]